MEGKTLKIRSVDRKEAFNTKVRVRMDYNNEVNKDLEFQGFAGVGFTVVGDDIEKMDISSSHIVLGALNLELMFVLWSEFSKLHNLLTEQLVTMATESGNFSILASLINRGILEREDWM